MGRVKSRNESAGSYDLVSHSSTADFMLIDVKLGGSDGGARALVRIKPTAYTVSSSLKLKVTTVEVRPGDAHPPHMLKLFKAKNAEYSMGHWRYEETCYCLSEHMSVLGSVAEERLADGSSVMVLAPAERDALPAEVLAKYSTAVQKQWRAATRAPVVLISQASFLEVSPALYYSPSS